MLKEIMLRKEVYMEKQFENEIQTTNKVMQGRVIDST